MKRTPLTRKTPLKAKAGLRSTASLERRTPVKKRNAKRLARRRKVQDAAQAEACRTSACCACLASLPKGSTLIEARAHGRALVDAGYRPLNPQAHHEPPRSRGGVDADTVPLCALHHHERHTIGARPFWAKYGLDPQQVKERMAALARKAA